jgi:hypothetical protein
MPADVIEPDLASQLADRLRHAEQYCAETLRAVRDAIELLPDDGDEDAE